jgi:hypothetical protein
VKLSAAGPEIKVFGSLAVVAKYKFVVQAHLNFAAMDVL